MFKVTLIKCVFIYCSKFCPMNAFLSYNLLSLLFGFVLISGRKKLWELEWAILGVTCKGFKMRTAHSFHLKNTLKNQPSNFLAWLKNLPILSFYWKKKRILDRKFVLTKTLNRSCSFLIASSKRLYWLELRNPKLISVWQNRPILILIK